MLKRFKMVVTLVLGVLTFMVPAARASMSVTAEELLALRKSEPANVLIVDVRTTGEYNAGHIPGAILIPMREIPSKMSLIGKDKKVVLVCASGARSGAVADYLSKNGYPWVRNYAGGMMDWERRGLPVDR